MSGISCFLEVERLGQSIFRIGPPRIDAVYILTLIDIDAQLLPAGNERMWASLQT